MAEENNDGFDIDSVNPAELKAEGAAVLARAATEEELAAAAERSVAETLAIDKLASDFNTHIAIFSELTDNEDFRQSLAKLSAGEVAPLNEIGLRVFGDGATIENIVGVNYQRIMDDHRANPEKNKNIQHGKDLNNPLVKKALTDGSLGRLGTVAEEVLEVIRLSGNVTDEEQKLFLAKQLLEKGQENGHAVPSQMENFNTYYEKSFGRKLAFNDKYQSNIDELSLLLEENTKKLEEERIAAEKARKAMILAAANEEKGIVGDAQKGSPANILIPAIFQTIKHESVEFIKEIFAHWMISLVTVAAAMALGVLKVLVIAAAIGLAYRFGKSIMKTRDKARMVSMSKEDYDALPKGDKKLAAKMLSVDYKSEITGLAAKRGDPSMSPLEMKQKLGLLNKK